ncbi:glycosyltransferase [Patescibacteria group bacterium]|nr:glycosyltransferase [Patescibacteria group bacterium]MCL5797828.1 glycosyltransferase [Patescibacteria group bacterium]
MKKASLLSIILPTYNESGNIVPLISQIITQIKSNPFEIWVVDDNSPDGTAENVKEKYKRDKRVHILVKKNERGLARAIRSGLEIASGKFIIVMDTDFNHNPKDLPLFLENKDKYDLIVGSRYIYGGGMDDRLRYFLSYLYNRVVRIILKLNTTDNLSGFFLINKQKLSLLNYDKIFFGYGDYFIRLLYNAHQFKFNIKEIPSYYKNRPRGLSKSQFLPMFIDYSKSVLKIASGK